MFTKVLEVIAPLSAYQNTFPTKADHLVVVINACGFIIASWTSSPRLVSVSLVDTVEY